MRYFITFGNKNYKRARKRLTTEARNIGVFDVVIGYSPKDFDEKFKIKHSNFIKNNTRGYGYFIWKPYLILKTLEMMNEDDILVYLDAGCKIYPQYKKRLLEYFQMVQESEFGLLNFILRTTHAEYTKADLLEYFKINKDPDYTNAYQVAGGILVMRKCPHVMKIMNEWFGVFETDYHLIDNTPSKLPELDGFKEHRHDQSVLSILVQKYGSIQIPDESYPPGNGPLSADRLKK